MIGGRQFGSRRHVVVVHDPDSKAGRVPDGRVHERTRRDEARGCPKQRRPDWFPDVLRDRLVVGQSSDRLDHFTEYAEIGHNVFMWAYTEPALVEWLFAQKR
jgi:hypothetical protein